MSKRVTTRWYIGAWVIWMIALMAAVAFARIGRHGSIVMAFAAVVAFVMWIGALVKLAQQRAWGWFAGVLVLQLIFLGIVGTVNYAIAGPEDTDEVAIRPSTT